PLRRAGLCDGGPPGEGFQGGRRRSPLGGRVQAQVAGGQVRRRAGRGAARPRRRGVGRPEGGVMSKAEQLRARFGGNINESMNPGGAARGGSPGPASTSAPGGSPGTGGSQEGVTRFREASRIALDRIIADPAQPRSEFDDEDLRRLADSLKSR